MNSGATEVGKEASQKTQNLSRFHPRSQERSGEDPSRPAGSDAKSKDGWVHTPSGLRPARTPLRPSASPVASIPKVEVPIPAAAPEEKPAPPSTDPLPLTHPVAAIPAWLPKEMSLAVKIALAAVFLLCLAVAFRLGESRGRKTAFHEIPPVPSSTPSASPTFPEDLLPELDAALQLLRNGNPLDALAALNKLAASHPHIPSIHYATALAAIQGGYPREADRMADASIKEGFRVSDSWALKAAIAAMQSKGPSAEQESLLKKAIAADPMNPNPFIEMASLLRYQNKSNDAAKLLESAAARLTPADSHAVAETTRAILAIDTGNTLLPVSAPLGIPSKDFPIAYSEMKRGNFQNAAAILRFTRDLTDPDLFAYLVNDPSLRKFAFRPELAEFY